MLERARQVFDIEIDGLRQLRDRLDDSFARAVEALLACHGKVIVTGLGKSGAIGRKIAATLASTGTPAIFLHATEGVHGDLGIIARDDLVLAISYSGETDEFTLIMPAIKRLNVPVIAVTGNSDSLLARTATIVLSVAVPREACPLGLAPTTSTTATLVLGDALAVAVYDRRGFTAEDFAFRHPGGSLGRSLLSVADLMHSGEQMPCVRESAPLSEVILEMSRKKLGMTCVVDGDGALAGVVTDGDLRRLLEENRPNLLATPIRDLLRSRSPRTIAADSLAVQALTIMEERQITSLIIAGDDRKPLGVIHIHDILRSKVV